MLLIHTTCTRTHNTYTHLMHVHTHIHTHNSYIYLIRTHTSLIHTSCTCSHIQTHTPLIHTHTTHIISTHLLHSQNVLCLCCLRLLNETQTLVAMAVTHTHTFTQSHTLTHPHSLTRSPTKDSVNSPCCPVCERRPPLVEQPSSYERAAPSVTLQKSSQDLA